MPTAARSGHLAAPPEAVWELIVDPHHQPRWWPGVRRMESVSAQRFTQVLATTRGRPVRVDWRIITSQAPTTLSWEQELAGSPFARVLQQSIVELKLATDGAGTLVTIAHVQKLRGASRTGGLMLRRATAKRLDEALAGLAAILTD